MTMGQCYTAIFRGKFQQTLGDTKIRNQPQNTSVVKVTTGVHTFMYSSLLVTIIGVGDLSNKAKPAGVERV